MPESLNDRSGSLVRNTITGYITFLSSSVLGFVLTPIILRHLGMNEFGIWALSLALVGYVGLVETGIGTATTTRVAAAESAGIDEVSSVLSTSFLLYLIVALVGLGVLGVLTFGIGHWFHIAPSLTNDARLTMLFVGGWQTVQFLSNVYIAALFGTGRLYVVQLSGFVVNVGVSITQAVLALSGAPVYTLAIALFGGSLLTIGWQRHVVQRVIPGVRVRLRRARRSAAMQILNLGVRNSASFFAGSLAYGSDAAIVGAILNPVAVASYSVASRAANVASLAMTRVSAALVPAYSRHRTVDAEDRSFRLFTTSISLSLLIAVPSSLTLIALGGPLLHVWLGDVPPGAARTLAFLGLLVCLQASGQSAFVMLVGSERGSLMMRIAVASAAVNVGVSIAMTFAVGVAGPAIGSVVASALFDTVYLPVAICRLLGRPLSDYFGRVLTRMLLPTVIAGSMAFAARALVEQTHDWVAVPCGAATFGCFWLLAWLIYLRREQRQIAIALVRGRLPGRRATLDTDEGEVVV